jgi:polyribonucleotide nucleotidyltransferase
LDLVVAGTESSVMMVESQADVLSEKEMLDAVSFGHDGFQVVIELIQDFAKEAGKTRWNVEKADTSDLQKKVTKLAEKALRDAYKETVKQDRSNKIAAVKSDLLQKLAEELGEAFDAQKAAYEFKTLEKNIVRGDIIKTGKRIDGRDLSTVRQIETEIGVLPKTHGSALFTRGETQALVVNTLGTTQDQQRIDSLEGDTTEAFMLHYNFPPYSVGEATQMRPPGRREIGHGKLAWRAIKALLPSAEVFPYTIRLVSEVTESNGSSSMATVCGASLALMDAGVPMKAAVAGIAMGLILEGKEFAVLSDILGDEDHLGDMDFKVAGTREGVTALQMDIKVKGITTEIMRIALNQAQEGRLHILEEMAKTIDSARGELSSNAPQITTIKIPVDKIGALIGPGGKNIKEICEVSGAKVDIEDDGTVRIAANNQPARDTALSMVQAIVAEPEVGQIYTGPVTRLLDFGALINFLGKHEGLCHISEITGQRIENIRDALNEGDVVKVKVVDIDRGRIRLSMRMVDQETGADISEGMEVAAPRPQAERGERRDRNNGGERGERRSNSGGKRRSSGPRDGNRQDEENGNNDDAPKKKTFF